MDIKFYIKFFWKDYESYDFIWIKFDNFEFDFLKEVVKRLYEFFLIFIKLLILKNYIFIYKFLFRKKMYWIFIDIEIEYVWFKIKN